jgi:hypothetical protein
MHLADYFSDDEELFPPGLHLWELIYCVGVTIGRCLMLSFLFSVYCLSLVVSTYIAALLTAYVLAPIMAALEGDRERFWVAIVSVYASAPFVAFLLFEFVKLFGTFFDAFKGLLLATFEGSFAEAKEVRFERPLARFVGVVGNMGFGIGVAWLVFFIDIYATIAIIVVGVLYLLPGYAFAILAGCMESVLAMISALCCPFTAITRRCVTATSDSAEAPRHELVQGCSDLGFSWTKHYCCPGAGTDKQHQSCRVQWPIWHSVLTIFGSAISQITSLRVLIGPGRRVSRIWRRCCCRSPSMSMSW